MSIKLSNKSYDVLKWIAQYFLPALGTLYFALASIWGLPYGEQVVGTITAFDAFLAVILGLSKSGYEPDGNLIVNGLNEDKDIMQIEFNSDDPILATKDKKYVTFKVNWNEEINGNS